MMLLKSKTIIPSNSYLKIDDQCIDLKQGVFVVQSVV